jgi:hypothetical protein
MRLERLELTKTGRQTTMVEAEERTLDGAITGMMIAAVEEAMIRATRAVIMAQEAAGITETIIDRLVAIVGITEVAEWTTVIRDILIEAEALPFTTLAQPWTCAILTVIFVRLEIFYPQDLVLYLTCHPASLMMIVGVALLCLWFKSQSTAPRFRSRTSTLEQCWDVLGRIWPRSNESLAHASTLVNVANTFQTHVIASSPFPAPFRIVK